MVSLVLLTASLAAAQAPTDRLVAVATEDDVFVYDVDQGGHAAGALQIGETVDLLASPGGRYLYGTGEQGVWPWRLYAGHSSPTVAQHAHRLDEAQSLAASRVPGEVWADHLGDAFAEWHPVGAVRGTIVKFAGYGSPVEALAVDRGLGELWSLDGNRYGRVFVAPVYGGRVENALDNAYYELTDLVAHPAAPGVLAVGRYESGGTSEAIIVHIDRTGVVDFEVLSAGRMPAELAVDPTGTRAWVLTEWWGLVEVDLTGGLQEASVTQILGATDVAVGLDSTVWVATTMSLVELDPTTPGLTEHPPFWTGDVHDLAVVEARQRGTQVGRSDIRLAALHAALIDAGWKVDAVAQWAENMDWDVATDANVRAEADKAVAQLAANKETPTIAWALDWLATEDPAGLARLLEDLTPESD